ncbi:hypothetical protein MROS_0775 [Melioribacter roseus P3M-2]|uniref:DUF1573 domain-containing protein n=1 Tax=Melioribacter roseus (strain DSM 23840 / JCM 17771 / VKM B-2668 / P3M-2) TaxID=1191523 RepID=I6YU12_MELRP|nr:DUF1573 domain-containing protein [Melioribacter roseus]AFN74017.1 hypothetical protein MROS_0775 [Melioribacter roseus P3M-2]
MKTKFTLPLAAIILLFLSYNHAVAQTASPRATVEPQAYDFGDIGGDSTVTAYFLIKNAGTDTLHILSARASCGCTAVLPDKRKLAPGETSSLKVSFNPKGKSGKQLKYVYLETDDPLNKRLKITIHANITSN